MKPIHLILLLLFFNCTTKNSNNGALQKPKTNDKGSTNKQVDYHKLIKLWVAGDFDGDKKTDTIYEHNFSRLQKKEIEFAPDPTKIPWDDVIKWFYDQDADITLILNKKNSDILHLGTGQGLYCLINIGDTNQDGNDEVALVIDKCDSSRINHCSIYSLCHGKWQLLKEFGVREDAFDWEGDIQPRFTSIKGYLEKQNNIWKYMDTNQQEYNSPTEAGQMKTLKLRKCNNQP